MDGDEAEDGGQVTEHLHGEEEQVDKQLEEWDDPPVAWEAQVILNDSTHTIIWVWHIVLIIWNNRLQVKYHLIVKPNPGTSQAPTQSNPDLNQLQEDWGWH